MTLTGFEKIGVEIEADSFAGNKLREFYTSVRW